MMPSIILFAFISSLLFVSRPTTIRSFVVTVNVLSLYSSVLPAKFTNVLKEGLVHVVSKLFKTTPSELNPTTTVIPVSHIIRVKTSVFNRLVSVVELVLWSSYSTFLFFCKHVFPEHVPTCSAVATSKVRRRDNGYSTTLTMTKKLIVSTLINSAFFNNFKFSKLLTNKVYFIHGTTKGIDRLVSSLSPSHTRLIMR